MHPNNRVIAQHITKKFPTILFFSIVNHPIPMLLCILVSV